VQEVPGSNPGSPTKVFKYLEEIERSFSSCGVQTESKNGRQFKVSFPCLVNLQFSLELSPPIGNPTFPTFGTYRIECKESIVVG
jgi:hypothetical protein